MDKIKELFSYCVSMPGAKKRQRPSTGSAEERPSPSKRNKTNGNSNKVTPVKATNNHDAVQEEEAQMLLSQNSASVISAQSPPIAPSQDTAPAARDETRSPSKPRKSKGRASTRVENREGVEASIGEQQQTAKEEERGKCDTAITPLQVSDTQKETNEVEEETHNNNTSAVVDQHNDKGNATALSESGGVHALEHIVLRSKVVAPDVSGIRCIAVNANESELVVARENGSLVLYRIEFFQNVPHFTLLRHTGGVTQRTITRLLYLTAPAYTNSGNSSMSISSTGAAREWLVASYLSGQIVLYDTVTLFPCSVVQRAGGAVWDMCRVGPSALYAAMANNTWHQLELTTNTTSAKEQVNAFANVELVLRRIIPGVTGADRALTVACSLSMQIAVGGDDAGNVHAWLPATYNNIAEEEMGGENMKGRRMDKKSVNSGEESRRGGLGEHTTLWTTRLPAGMALALLCVPHSVNPVIVAGTSVGDVVLLDPHHGQQLHRFSQHKGPVTALVSDGVAFYASGWHESLRAYRCTTTTTTAASTQQTEYTNATLGWYPAEVKRRTHYHEATQLLLCNKQELLLSCARDGTILYSPLSQLFRSPAMYLTVTTQQFAFAQARNILLQSRVDRVEGFGMSAAQRHWLPLFAHRLQGGHHLSGLWCDAALNYFVAATDERVVVCHVMWRKAKKEGTTMSVRALHEVLELPARRGVLDACFVAPSSTHQSNTDEEKNKKKKRSARASWLYLLTDDGVAFASLSADTSPIVVHTAFDLGSGATNTSLAHTLRPLRVLYDTASDELRVFGLYGMWHCRVLHDGTPDAATQQLRRDRAYSLVHAVPKLHTTTTDKDEQSMKEDDERQEGEECTWIGLALSTQHNNNNTLATASSPSATATRYMTHIQRELPQQQLARTLPHDTQFVAELATSLRFAPPREESPFYARRGKARLSSSSPSAANEGRAALVEKYNTNTNGESTNKNERDRAYVGYFSKGLLVSNGAAWRMAQRMSVEAAFVMQDNTHVLVLERNLEKTLESLPLCWKVRRFGN